MKHYWLLAFLFFISISSCKLSLYRQVKIYGTVSLDLIYNDDLPINANLKLFDQSFNLISEIDSTFDGKYTFKFKKNRKKKYYLVMSDVKVIVETYPNFKKGFTFCTEQPNDTIEILVEGEHNIQIKNCEVKTSPMIKIPRRY